MVPNLAWLKILRIHGRESMKFALASMLGLGKKEERSRNWTRLVVFTDSCRVNYASYVETLTTINFSFNFKSTHNIITSIN
jgi:hypothetical protein